MSKSLEPWRLAPWQPYNFLVFYEVRGFAAPSVITMGTYEAVRRAQASSLVEMRIRRIQGNNHGPNS